MKRKTFAFGIVRVSNEVFNRRVTICHMRLSVLDNSEMSLSYSGISFACIVFKVTLISLVEMRTGSQLNLTPNRGSCFFNCNILAFEIGCAVAPLNQLKKHRTIKNWSNFLRDFFLVRARPFKSFMNHITRLPFEKNVIIYAAVDGKTVSHKPKCLKEKQLMYKMEETSKVKTSGVASIEAWL